MGDKTEEFPTEDVRDAKKPKHEPFTIIDPKKHLIGWALKKGQTFYIPSVENYFDGMKYSKVLVNPGCTHILLPLPHDLPPTQDGDSNNGIDQLITKYPPNKYKWKITLSNSVSGTVNNLVITRNINQPSFTYNLGTDVFPVETLTTNNLRYQLSSSTAQLIKFWISVDGSPGYRFSLKFRKRLQEVIDEKIEYPKREHVLLGQTFLEGVQTISDENSVCFFNSEEFDRVFPNAMAFFDFTETQLKDKSNLPQGFLDWRDEALKESSDEESCHSHSDSNSND